MTAINRILIVDDEDNVRRMLSTAFLHYKDSKHIVRTTDAQHYTCLPIFTLTWC